MIATAAMPSTAARDAKIIANALKIRYTPFAVARGEGAYLFDEAGKRYLDFSAGWAVAGLATTTRACGRPSSVNCGRPPLPGSSPPSTRPRSIWQRDLSPSCPATSRRRSGSGTPVRMPARWRNGWCCGPPAAVASSPSSAAGMARLTLPWGSPPIRRCVDAPGGAHVTKAPYPNPYRRPFGDASRPCHRPVPLASWRTTSSGRSARHRTWPRSLSRRCRATPAISCRRPTSCRSCVPSATGTASCSSSTRSRRVSAALAACSPSSTAASPPTSSSSGRPSAAGCR